MDGNDRFPMVTNKGKPLSPFISKLKLLLNDVKYRRAIRWSDNGAAIVITDGETFKKLVLDRSEEMFKTRNFTSFVRQLNLYGFRKVPVSGKADPAKNMKFDHVHFKRDHPELMYQVRRTCTPSKKKKKAGGKKRTSPEPYGDPFDDADIAVEEETESDNSFSAANFMHCTPTKHSLSYTNNFNHSSNSPFEPPPREGESWDYLYRKFEDERMAVQLLLNLRYSSPSQSSDEFHPVPPYAESVYNHNHNGCSCSIYPSPPFHTHASYFNMPMDLPHLAQ